MTICFLGLHDWGKWRKATATGISFLYGEKEFKGSARRCKNCLKDEFKDKKFEEETAPLIT